MIRRIKDYIRQYQIIGPQDHIICGLSGGADSVCLFLVLLELREELGFSLEALHVEHGIRGQESRRDMEFTQRLCRAKGVELVTVMLDVPAYAREKGLGLEEAARILRYQALSKRARETGGRIALAHHMDDNAETVIFQMLRGSGVKGIAGIAPVRKDDGITYIRPLLCVTRAEIEEYLKAIGQDYCIDSTNEDTNYDRNRLRHVVFPELISINSQAVAHINQTAGMASEMWDFYNEKLMSACEEALSEKEGQIYLDMKKCEGLHSALQRGMVLEAIARAAGRRKDISAVHVASVMELWDRQTGRQVDLPYNIVAIRQYDYIVFKSALMLSEAEPQAGSENAFYEISSQLIEEARDHSVRLFIGAGQAESLILQVLPFDGQLDKIPKKAYTKWVAYDKIKSGFSVRKRRSEDFFFMDNQGHRKKLKDHFVNEKIPASERDNIWVLASGSEIIDIIGGRLAEPYKVLADTKEILEIRYDGGK